MNRHQRDRVVATHEAGHCVMMELSGQRVLKATIEKVPGLLGHVDGDQLKYPVIHCVLNLLAGVAAERLYCVFDEAEHKRYAQNEWVQAGKLLRDDYLLNIEGGHFDRIRSNVAAFQAMAGELPDNIECPTEIDGTLFTDEAIASNDDELRKAYIAYALNMCLANCMTAFQDDQCRKAILRLAEKLVQHRTLSGEKVRAIITKFLDITESRGTPD